MMRWIVAAMMLAMPTVATAEVQQFDLSCKAGKVEKRYRIDLAQGEWCADACSPVRRIASVTSGTLLLEEEGPDARGDQVVTRIDRGTGAWFYLRNLPSLSFSKTVTGTCSPSSFSGFPARKF